MSKKKALLLFIEPTPYIHGLIVELSQQWPAGIDVFFIGENLSQEWNTNLSSLGNNILPTEFNKRIKKIYALLSTKQYSVIHLAGWGHPLLLVTMFFAWILRLPITIESDTPLPPHIHTWKRILKKCLYPLLFKLPTMFLPGGTKQAKYLQYYHVPTSRITIAQMTVDVTHITQYIKTLTPPQRSQIRHQLGIQDNATVFLYIGRMEPHKGVLELIQAFSQLTSINQSPMTLLLVGDGSLSNLIQQKSTIDPRIKSTGRLSGNALLNTYAIANIFVLASSFEPWGLVINEAMAAGLPVIATDRVGCIDDLVTHEKTGLIIPAESSTALTTAMQTLIQSSDLRQSMSTHSQALISKWTLKNEAKIITNTWTKIYHDSST